MDEDINQAVAPATPPKAPAGDLSREIARAVPREPQDRVKCVRVFGDHYRCNWWAPAGDDAARHLAAWALTAIHRVRKSRFLRATARGAKLTVEDLGRDDAAAGNIGKIVAERNPDASL